EVLRFTAGTFASSKDLSVAGKGFKISRIKYLAPILYDADSPPSAFFAFSLFVLQLLFSFRCRIMETAFFKFKLRRT
ncbi:MAG: hypothetical protein ACLUGE_14190, partial [Blautia sp.]